MKSTAIMFRTFLLAVFTLALLGGAIFTDYYVRHEVTRKAKRFLADKGVEPNVDSAIVAAKSGDLVILEKLETAGILLGEPNEFGQTPLLASVAAGSTEAIDFLIEKEEVAAGINHFSVPERETPLSLALEERNFALADRLRAVGGDLSVDIEPGLPFLISAIETGDDEMLDYLLTNKVDVHYKGTQPTTALAVSSNLEKLELMSRLLDEGANPDDRGISGKPLLIESVREGSREKFDLLIQHGADVNAKTGETTGSEMTALSFAIASEEADMMEILLEKGATADVYGISGQPLAYEVVLDGRKEVVSRLIESGTTFDVVTENQETPLSAAAMNDDLDMVDLLLDNSVDPSPEVEGGVSPLMASVANGNVAIANQLITSGAALDKDALLAKAFELRDDPLMNLLLHAGANPEAVIPGTDQRVFDAAIQDGATGAVRTLLAAGAAIGDNLWAALLTEQDDLIRLILDAGADPRQKGPEGQDPLDYCLKKQRYRAARVLLDGGADPNARYSDSRTWLEHAIREGNQDISTALIEAGATVKGVKASDGHTLLGWAIGHEMEGTVAALLAAGVDPDTQERTSATSEFQSLFSSSTFKYHLRVDRRITPMMMAAAERNHNIAQMLMDAGANGKAYTPKYLMAAIIGSWYKDSKMQQIALLGKVPEVQPRKVVVDLSSQRVTLYENGVATYSTRCSTGKSGYRTPTGEYVISDRHRHHTSSIYGSSMPFFQRFSYSAFGLHQGYVPGYPASHGCIRLPYSSAQYLFGKLKVGDYAVIQH